MQSYNNSLAVIHPSKVTNDHNLKSKGNTTIIQFDHLVVLTF